MAARFVVVVGLLVNAVIGQLLYRGAFQEMGHEPWLAATGIALIVAVLAWRVATKPDVLTLQLARGCAVGMLIGMCGIALLAVVAANFENGGSRGFTAGIVAFLVGLLAAQTGILVGCERIDHAGWSGSMDSAAKGAFKFWVIVIAIALGASILERSIGMN